jgi:thiol-disulfide isomerase/thioredoxin
MTNDMPEPALPPSAARSRIPLVIGAILIGTIAAMAGIYGFGALKHPASAGDSACAGAISLSHRLAPLAHGEVAALTMAATPLQLPDLSFEDGDGKTRKLSEWRGRTVLLNLWATWCVPCRKEMPALEGLQTRLSGPQFDVIAVNIDTRDADKRINFMKDAKLTRLGSYNDTKAKVFQDLKSIGRALGMPTSVLVDPQGCEIGTIAGPAEWDSEDAVKLITAAIDPAAAGL